MTAPRKAHSWYEIEGPVGERISIPVDTDSDVGFSADAKPDDLRAFYADQGYVVIRQVVPANLCASVLRTFRAEVKPSRGYFVRHKTGLPERHVFTASGFMKYPIMNPHELPSRLYSGFRAAVLNVLTDYSVRRVVEALLGLPPQLVHTMFFEGNQRTWPHCDSSYIDASLPGQLVGVWVALEDIKPGAGRFYIYAKSHKAMVDGADLDPNAEDYVTAIKRQLRQTSLACVAPALATGDVLLWSSRTIHGSLLTTQPECSRACVTGHFIPMRQRMVWFQRRNAAGEARLVGAVPVMFHADQDRAFNHLRIAAIGRWPKTYQAALKAAKRVRAAFL